MASKYNDIIEKYFNGDMSAEEKKAFLDALSKDDAMMAAYEWHKKTMAAIRIAGRNDLKNRLRMLEAKRPSPVWQWEWAAWSTLVIYIVGILLWTVATTFYKNENQQQGILLDDGQKHTPNDIFSGYLDSLVGRVPLFRKIEKIGQENKNIENQEKGSVEHDRATNDPGFDPDKLYAANFTVFRDPSMDPGIRGEGSNDPGLNFMQAYWQQQYLDAIVIYEKMLRTSQPNSNLQFQYANCLAYAGRYAEAAEVFHKVAANPESRFDQAAEFYEALMLLKLRRPEQSGSISIKISKDPDHPFYMRSKAILKKMY